MDSLVMTRASKEEFHSRGMELFAVQLAFVVVAGMFVLARAYVKVCIVKSVAVDDWLIFFAMIMYVAYGTVAMHGVTHGATGKHVTELTTDEAAVSLRGWYICEVLYSPMTLAIRTSICLLLLRLALNKVHRWIIYINLTVIVMISVAFFFIMTFQCMPPSYFWRQLYGDPGSCINLNIVPDATIAHSVVSAISDWCMGLLPIALLWNVSLNRRTKALIAVLLSMGMVAGVALIVRIPYVRRLAISADFLYETIDVAIWSVMEPALGIIAASVTSMRPLFQGWGFGWSSSGKSSRPSGAAWADSGHAAYKEPPTPKGRGIISDKSKSTGRTYDDDIERAMASPTGSDIELNKTTRTDSADEHEYPESHPSSDLGRRSHHHREAQVLPADFAGASSLTVPSRPVINVRTTIDIRSHSADHVLPATTISASDESEDEKKAMEEEQPAGRMGHHHTKL